jgi:lysine-ketoglutarate reductase/saccharopine dehydrogenase-like protein (TIGR00300 family)
MSQAPPGTQEIPFPNAHRRTVVLAGHLLDTGLINRALDLVTDSGCQFEIEHLNVGVRKEHTSTAHIAVIAPTADALEQSLGLLIQEGATFAESESDARLEAVTRPGVAPDDFYSTTIYPTDVRIEGRWVRVQKQRMDVMLVVRDSETVVCTLMRDLQPGDRVVCGVDGIRIHAAHTRKAQEEFAFMSSGVSSERRVEVAVDQIARDMRDIRAQGGKVVVVAGPVVVHTGGAGYLSELIRQGYVQALLGGNAIAVHDMEQAIFGTSLGVDMARGVGVHEGHKHHLRVINTIRGCGGIAQAVEQGVLTGGIMYECVRQQVPFLLAGSIRDVGPLPETIMDLVRAQHEYARAIEGADMIIMLSSMLHSIGTGNMTPAGVKLICVDISPAVVTKLADRGSVESVGIVTDVGLFLNLLLTRLGSG